MTADLIAELAEWEDAGAAWRVVTIGPEHATVALLQCTGETVEHRETGDPERSRRCAARLERRLAAPRRGRPRGPSPSCVAAQAASSWRAPCAPGSRSSRPHGQAHASPG